MTSVSEALTAVRRVDARVLGPALLGCGLLLVAVGYLGVELAAVAVGLPLVLVAVVLLSARPLIVLQLMIVVEVSNATNVLEEHIPRIFHAVLALGVLTLVRLLLTSRDARRAMRPALPVAAALLGCFLFGQLLAVSVSEESAVSASVLIRYAVDGLFILVLAALMVAVRRPWAVAAAVTVSFAALGALGVLNEIVFDGAATFGGFATVSDASGELTTTLRHAGPLPDSNFWGRHLVLGAAAGRRAAHPRVGPAPPGGGGRMGRGRRGHPGQRLPHPVPRHLPRRAGRAGLLAAGRRRDPAQARAAGAGVAAAGPGGSRYRRSVPRAGLGHRRQDVELRRGSLGARPGGRAGDRRGRCSRASRSSGSARAPTPTWSPASPGSWPPRCWNPRTPRTTSTCSWPRNPGSSGWRAGC